MQDPGSLTSDLSVILRSSTQLMMVMFNSTNTPLCRPSVKGHLDSPVGQRSLVCGRLFSGEEKTSIHKSDRAGMTETLKEELQVYSDWRIRELWDCTGFLDTVVRFSLGSASESAVCERCLRPFRPRPSTDRVHCLSCRRAFTPAWCPSNRPLPERNRLEPGY